MSEETQSQKPETLYLLLTLRPGEKEENRAVVAVDIEGGRPGELYGDPGLRLLAITPGLANFAMEVLEQVLTKQKDGPHGYQILKYRARIENGATAEIGWSYFTPQA